jgi:uncharacterized damage-inducible protein DinB
VEEEAMNLIDALIGEYEHECKVTRKTLERVPDAKLGWKPHTKSMTMGQLASHLAEIPGWVASTMGADEFNFDSGYKPFAGQSTAEILKTFDKNTSEALAAMKKGVSNETLMKKWTLKANGHPLFSMPKAGALRSFVFSHQIHHRGQLSVYLRLNDVPVPAIYGPSADEQG